MLPLPRRMFVFQTQASGVLFRHLMEIRLTGPAALLAVSPPPPVCSAGIPHITPLTVDFVPPQPIVIGNAPPFCPLAQ